MTDPTTTDITHNIEAFYTSNGYEFRPVLTCSCGFTIRAFNWQDCGLAMDRHLREVRS
jgi:hypothetical protein